MATITVKNLLTAAAECLHNPALDCSCTWNVGLSHMTDNDLLVGAAEGGNALSAEGLQYPVNHTEGNVIEIPVYGNKGQYLRLNPGATATLTAETDSEIAFYLALRKENVLEVTSNVELVAEA